MHRGGEVKRKNYRNEERTTGNSHPIDQKNANSGEVKRTGRINFNGHIRFVRPKLNITRSIKGKAWVEDRKRHTRGVKWKRVVQKVWRPWIFSSDQKIARCCLPYRGLGGEKKTRKGGYEQAM